MADKYEIMFNEEWEKLKNEKRPLPNIMLLGETGCGKSSLINRIFGKEIAYVNDTKRGTVGFETYYGKDYDIGVNLIDSRGYELSDGKSETFESYYRAIEEKMEESRKDDPFKKIHIIWYCVSVTGDRFQDYDADTVNMLLKDDELKKRVCLVITKCDNEAEDGSESRAIAEVAKSKTSRNLPIFCVSTDPKLPLELENLIDWSVDQLDDDDLKEAFVQSQIISLKAKRKSAGIAIAFYTAVATAIGASPIPFSDAALLTPLQVAMSTHIINRYGMSSMVNITKSLVGAVLIPMLGRSLAGNLLKLIPVVGQGMGALINGGVAGSITTVLGCAISQICYVSCEKIAKGEKVDFEEVFSSDSILEAVKNFNELKKNKGKNDFISPKEADPDKVKKYADSYREKYIDDHD